MTTHLVWFRADLRVQDNLALAAACRYPDVRVIALFIATPAQWQQHHMAPRQAALLNAHLNTLQQALAEKGIPLLYREVDDFAACAQAIAQICASEQVSHLFYNYQYEFNERQRDAAVEKALPNVSCQGLMTA